MTRIAYHPLTLLEIEYGVNVTIIRKLVMGAVTFIPLPRFFLNSGIIEWRQLIGVRYARFLADRNHYTRADQGHIPHLQTERLVSEIWLAQ